MAYQSVFKRYELKYLLTQAQKKQVLAAMEAFMKLDDYGRTTIQNFYFDTPKRVSTLLLKKWNTRPAAERAWAKAWVMEWAGKKAARGMA